MTTTTTTEPYASAATVTKDGAIKLVVAKSLFERALAGQFKPTRRLSDGTAQFVVDGLTALRIGNALGEKAAELGESKRPPVTVVDALWGVGERITNVAEAVRQGNPALADEPVIEVPDDEVGPTRTRGARKAASTEGLTDGGFRPVTGPDGRLDHSACGHARTTWGRRQCQQSVTGTTPVKRERTASTEGLTDGGYRPVLRADGKWDHSACGHAKTTWGRRQCQFAANASA